MDNQTPVHILSILESRSRLLRGQTQFYQDVADGLIPRPVKVGARGAVPAARADVIARRKATMTRELICNDVFMASTQAAGCRPVAWRFAASLEKKRRLTLQRAHAAGRVVRGLRGGLRSLPRAIPVCELPS